MRINQERLEKNIEEFAKFGINEVGGIDRSLGSIADELARNWLIQKAESLGATVKIDAIANIWIKADCDLISGAKQVTCENQTNSKVFNTSEISKKLCDTKLAEEGNANANKKLAPITVGSHHDAVSNGGKLDGALGVLLGIEILETLKENKVPLKHPFQVVSFTAEEPNPFNISTMGSRSITRKLEKDLLLQAKSSANNEKLTDAIARVGGDLMKLEDSYLTESDIAAFLECHIEQGRNLYDHQLSTAVVSKITGIYRESIRVLGEANHAGTTRMEHRKDALLAAAEASLVLESIVSSLERSDVVATVGKFDIFPNSANIIPSIAEFIFDVRVPEGKVKDDIVTQFDKEVLKIEKKRKVIFERKVILDQSEVTMDETVMQAVAVSIEKEQACPLNASELEKQGIYFYKKAPMLTSMAGHDAVHMSGITRTGMLFVQSINGKSHCAEEETDSKDILVAGNVLLQTVLTLDEELA